MYRIIFRQFLIFGRASCFALLIFCFQQKLQDSTYQWPLNWFDDFVLANSENLRDIDRPENWKQNDGKKKNDINFNLIFQRILVRQTYSAIIQLNVVNSERCRTWYRYEICSRSKWIWVWPKKCFRKRSAAYVITAKDEKKREREREKHIRIKYCHLSTIVRAYLIIIIIEAFRIKVNFCDDTNALYMHPASCVQRTYIVYRSHHISSSKYSLHPSMDILV